MRNLRIIDTGVLRDNMRKIRAAVPAGAKVMAVVKSDAYGHGAVRTAETVLAAGADALAVATTEEGCELRRAGITAPVLVLGAILAEDAEGAVQARLTQTVCSPESVALAEKAAAAAGKTAEVHLKVDTGMGRIGVRTAEERDAVLEALRQAPHVRLTGVFTHFADADGDEDGMAATREQYERFLTLTAPLAGSVIRHCANSAAIHRFPEMALDMVRAGISLYGYPPVEDQLHLKPAMTWLAEVSYVKTLDPGSSVSYGRTWRAEKPVRIATVTCGYGDGYHRAATGRVYVLIRGRKAPVVGRICMDQMMADVTEIPDVIPGDRVTLMGTDGSETVDAEDLAAAAGTISYEVLLAATGRVFRRWTDGTEKSE